MRRSSPVPGRWPRVQKRRRRRKSQAVGARSSKPDGAGGVGRRRATCGNRLERLRGVWVHGAQPGLASICRTIVLKSVGHGPPALCPASLKGPAAQAVARMGHEPSFPQVRRCPLSPRAIGCSFSLKRGVVGTWCQTKARYRPASETAWWHIPNPVIPANYLARTKFFVGIFLRLSSR